MGAVRAWWTATSRTVVPACATGLFLLKQSGTSACGLPGSSARNDAIEKPKAYASLGATSVIGLSERLNVQIAGEFGPFLDELEAQFRALAHQTVDQTQGLLGFLMGFFAQPMRHHDP